MKKTVLVAALCSVFTVSAWAQEETNKQLIDGSSGLFSWIFDVNADSLKKNTPASEYELKPYFKKGFFSQSVFAVQVEPGSYAGDQFGEWKPDHSLMYQSHMFSEVAVRSGGPLDPCFSTLGALQAILNPKGTEQKQYVALLQYYQKKEIRHATGLNAPGVLGAARRLFSRASDQERASEPALKSGEPYMDTFQVPETVSGRYTSADDLKKRGLASSDKILQSYDFCAARIKENPAQLKKWSALGGDLNKLRTQVVDLLQISQKETPRKSH